MCVKWFHLKRMYNDTVFVFELIGNGAFLSFFEFVLKFLTNLLLKLHHQVKIVTDQGLPSSLARAHTIPNHPEYESGLGPFLLQVIPSLTLISTQSLSQISLKKMSQIREMAIKIKATPGVHFIGNFSHILLSLFQTVVS